MVKIELNKRDSFLVAFLVVLVGVGFVYAYGGTAPSVMGHSAGELELPGDTNANTICSGDTFLSGDGSCWTATEIVKAGGGSGSTTTTVVAMDHKECYNGDVYWYTSTGSRGVKVEECGSVDGDVCRDYEDSAYCARCEYNSGLAEVCVWVGERAETKVCTDVPKYGWSKYDGQYTGIVWNDVVVLSGKFPNDITTEHVYSGYLYYRGDLVSGVVYDVCRTNSIVQ